VPALKELTDYDKETLKEFADVKNRLEQMLDNFKFRDAQKEAMNLARIGNKYLAETEPWKLVKTDMDRTSSILHIALQIAANLAIAFEPFLPFSSEKLRKMLNMQTFEWNQLGRVDLLPEGSVLGKAELLFEKIEDALVDAQVKRLHDIKAQNEAAAAEAEAKEKSASWKPEPVKEYADFEGFEKLDIRVGTILECTNVPKSDKLLKFKIDDGMGGRTILSGIAKSYPNPEELVGKQVCFVANFKPRKMMGLESQGMIMSAVNSDGKLVVISPSKEVANGCEVG
jgi:methionyl-tRNA synthetase